MKNPQFAIVYKDGQVKASYHNQEDVLATLYHCWTATSESRCQNSRLPFMPIGGPVHQLH